MRHLHDATLSELDYERLPPALRRKFFSSLERLRLAQNGAFPSRSPHDLASLLSMNLASSSSPFWFSRRSVSQLDDSLKRSQHPQRNRLRKHSLPPSRGDLVSQRQVAQFASLPPAVQRKQFSREHQILFANRIQSIILDAADEAVYKQFWTQRLLRSAPASSRRSSSSVTLSESHIDETDEVDCDCDYDCGYDGDYHLGYDHHDNEYDFDDDFDDDDMDTLGSDWSSLRWLDEHQDIDLRLHDYHAAIAETAARHADAPSRHRTKRSTSISSITFPRLSLDKKRPLGRTSLPASLTQSRSTSSFTPTKGHRRNKGSVTSLEPAATHYQDPAARAKLRVYLASPQKFDEAIEFGFPSMQDRTAVRSPVNRKASMRTAEDTGMTFFDDDTPSLSDGEDREFEDIESPRTPSATAFSQATSHETGLDRSHYRPRMTKDYPDPYVHGSASNREMTLHMTLTRPDLRSPDEISSTHRINSMPLEQPPLTFPSTHPTSFWDSLPDEESKMKKFFRKLKLRN